MNKEKILSLNNTEADTEQILRLVQSVPSKKAEPFKLWLANVRRYNVDILEEEAKDVI